MTEWSWLKASLPSSRGGVNLRWASSHARAAFIASSTSSQDLVDQILHQPPSPAIDPDLNQPSNPSTDLTLALEALSTSASRPEWQLLDDIDVPLTQHHLSAAIDEAVLQ